MPEDTRRVRIPAPPGPRVADALVTAAGLVDVRAAQPKPGGVLAYVGDGKLDFVELPLPVAGAAGGVGSPGPAGADGATGATGPTGATGATGAAGATGATGPAGIMGLMGPPGPPGAPDLTVDTDWYCDSVSGDDVIGDGSIGAPWATLARAWEERDTYGRINGATLHITLLGQGPYTLPPMGFSVCTNSGRLVISGDRAQFDGRATGTYSGGQAGDTYHLGFADNGVTTSNMGGDYSGFWVRILSGVNAGAEFTAWGATATQQKPAGPPAYALALGAGVGSSFEKFWPGTKLNVASNASGPRNWVGGSMAERLSAARPGHVFYNLTMTRSASPYGFTVGNSDVGFTLCRFSTCHLFVHQSRVSFGDYSDTSFMGTTGPGAQYAGVHFVDGELHIMDGSEVGGYCMNLFSAVALGPDVNYPSSPNNYLSPKHSYFGGPVDIENGQLRLGLDDLTMFNDTLTIKVGGRWVSSYSYPFLYVASGDCIRIDGGEAVFDNGYVDGTTTDASARGVRVTGGGSLVLRNTSTYQVFAPGDDWATDTLSGVGGAFAAAPSGQIDPVTGSKIVRV